MKSGFNAHDTTFSERVISTGTHLLNELLVYAIENACKYAKSAGRDNMSGQDIIIALQYEAHEFTYRQQSNENESDSESEPESDCESVGENDSDEQADTFTRSYSNDPLIEKMNYYHDTWDSWDPEVPIERTLKNAVDNAIEMYK